MTSALVTDLRTTGRRWRRRGERLVERLLGPLTGTVVAAATREPVVALTFDDGPHPHYTPRMLEVLERHGARGTFFLLGSRAGRYPQLVRDIVRRGHALGNHSWDHPSFPAIDGVARRHQLRRCRAVLAGADGGLFRPPFGHQGLAARVDAALLGYRPVTWSGHIEDWTDIGLEERELRLERALAPGAILLLHDSPYREQPHEWYRREQTLEALERVLSRRRDYTFVTVPQLLRVGRPVYRQWFKRGDPAFVAAMAAMSPD